MKPLSTCIVLFFICLQSTQLTAQQKLRPGYIVQLNGDTAKGMVEFGNWIANPLEIRFAANDTGGTIAYKAGEIKSFEVSGEIYVSAIIRIDKSSQSLEQLGFTAELEYTDDTVFLQQLFGGAKSLFYYRDKSGLEQFFIGPKDDIAWLTYKAYLKDIDGLATMQSNSQFRSQLSAYLTGCEKIQPAFKRIEYRLPELKQLFRDYYACTDAGPSFERKAEKMKYEAGVIAGLSSTGVTFNSTVFDFLSKGAFNKSTAPTAGIFGNIFFKRKLKRLSLCNEAIYQSYDISGTYSTYDPIDGVLQYSSILSFGYIKINNLLRYTLPAGKFSLFVNAGISNGFVTRAHNLKVREVLGPFPSRRESPAIATIRNHEESVMAGIGARLSRFIIEFRYENGNGMSSMSALGVNVERLYMLAGFRL